MRNLRWLVTAAALSLALTAGCKKDEPKPEPKAPAAKPAEPAKGTDKTDEGTGEAPAATDKTDEAQAATDKTDEGTGEAQAATDKTDEGTGEAPAPAPTAGAVLEMPADVVAVASIPGFDTLFGAVKGKADKYGLPMPAKDVVMTMVAEAAKTKGLKSLDWFAGDKAIHVLVFNPKKFQNGMALVPVTDKDKLIAALPDEKTADDEGNAFSMAVADGAKGYLNFIDGYAVVTGEAGAFAAGKEFAEKVASQHKPTGQVDVRVAANNLKAIFADELTAAKGQINELKPMIGQMLQKEMPIPGLAGLDEVINFYLGLAETILDESETLTWGVELDDNGNLSLPLTLTVKPEGRIAKFIGGLQNADLSFVKTAPASSWLLFGGQMDPKAMDGVMKYATEMLGAVLKLSDEEKTKITDLFNTLMELQDGKSWFAFYADGKFPMAMAGEAGLKDGKKYQEAFDAYMGMVMGKALAMVKDVLPPQLQTLPTDDFAKLIEAVDGMTKNFGVSIEAGTATEGDVTVQRLVISLDEATLARVAGPEAAAKLKLVTDITGTRLEFAMAYGTTKMAMAFGPNAVKTATQIAGGTFTGGGQSVVDMVGAGTAMFMHMDVAAGIAAWKPVIDIAGAGDQIPAFEAGSAAGFAMGGSGNTITFKVYGSLDKFVTAGMAAFQKMGKREEPVEEKAAEPEGEKADDSADGEDKPAEGEDKPAEGAGAAGAAVVPAE